MSSRKLLTLALVRNTNNILLGLKKRGFGVGKWNGYGGKVEVGETIDESAKREVQEECGLVVKDLQRVGLLEFNFVGDSELLEVHVFTTSSFSGQIVETEEMYPKWFPINEIPFDKMWLDDRYWLPLFLDNKTFRGYFVYQGHDNILRHTLAAVEQLPG